MSTIMSDRAAPAHPESRPSFLDRLNGPWHERALWIFLAIVLAHWSEHIAQAWQVYVLDWPVHESRGVLGLWFPWLVHAEILHYGYALIMLGAIWALRPGFVGASRAWWTVALAIQFWHHFEHALLQGQAITGHNLFGAAAPTSVAQLVIPRVELHLLYNSLVFVPMVVAMLLHMFPPAKDAARMECTCSWRTRVAAAA